MTDPKEALQDLQFMKDLVTRTRFRASSMAPYFVIWGLVWMAGFGFSTWVPRWAGWFWTGIDVLGAAASAWVGVRQNRESRNWSALGLWPGINWSFLPLLLLGMILAFFALQGGIAWEYMGAISVVIIGAAYLQAGLILGREMLGFGVWLLILGVSVPTWFMPYQGILFGFLGGGSMALTGLVLRRWGDRAPTAR